MVKLILYGNKRYRTTKSLLVNESTIYYTYRNMSNKELRKHFLTFLSKVLITLNFSSLSLTNKLYWVLECFLFGIFFFISRIYPFWGTKNCYIIKSELVKPAQYHLKQVLESRKGQLRLRFFPVFSLISTHLKIRTALYADDITLISSRTNGHPVV